MKFNKQPRNHQSQQFTMLKKLPIIRKSVQIKRILLVDDDCFNLIALKTVLGQAEQNLYKRLSQKALGYKVKPMSEDQSILKKVVTRNNGQEAVDAIKEAHIQGSIQYSLILMDCSMPVLDGYQASDQIKKYLKLYS